MSTWKFIGYALVQTGKLTGRVAMSTVRLTGNALHGASEIVAAHHHEIAAGAKAVVSGAGTVVRYGGRAVQSGAQALATELHGVAKQSDHRLAKVVSHTLGYTADAVGWAGKGTSFVGDMTERAAPVIGAVTGGLVTGAVDSVSKVVDSVAVSDAEIQQLTARFRKQSLILQGQSALRVKAVDAAIASRHRKNLLDLLVVGGMTLAAVIRFPENIPPEVVQAFQLAYPGLARGGETFADVVQRLGGQELLGLVNGVKGKLFEVELVEHLNSGYLPDGVHAELAASATQPGFDVQILDEHGHVVGVLQAKATESAAYVKDALERYPDIDVMTTTEVHAHLVALGAAEQVSDSGISETALQAKVEAAAVVADGHTLGATDMLPTSLGLAIIALSVWTTKGASAELMGQEFGHRTAQAGLSTYVGKAALVASGAWWVALAAGVGTRWLASHGGNKRERLEALKRAVEGVDTEVGRNRRLMVGVARGMLMGTSIAKSENV